MFLINCRLGLSTAVWDLLRHHCCWPGNDSRWDDRVGAQTSCPDTATFRFLGPSAILLRLSRKSEPFHFPPVTRACSSVSPFSITPLSFLRLLSVWATDRYAYRTNCEHGGNQGTFWRTTIGAQAEETPFNSPLFSPRNHVKILRRHECCSAGCG